MIDIVKKNGSEAVSVDTPERKHLIEELADVLMYYNDVLLCYGITAEELKETYINKFQTNMNRW
ncbi:MAG: nucleotide pyrophosphohydrolase [Butyrivibrio sp.]|nr:nucleotide pyrophosphohydrolase [Butyrivibrio sp.]